MCRKSLGSRADAPANRSGQRPRRPSWITGFAAVLASAVITLSAVPAAARAATATGPSASLAFTAARVTAGTRPVLRFSTSDIPAGSVIYLETAAGAGHSWRFVGRIKADSGAVRLPADPAGRYEYRILVAQGDTTVTTSAPASLTVTTATTAATVAGRTCAACEAVKDLVPWLAPIVAPAIASFAQQVGSAVFGLLALLFG
jgi:hypothetical protein